MYESLKNNKNAEKYNFIKSVRLFYKAIELSTIKEDGAYIYDFIGEITSEMGLYRDIFTHLLKRFPTLKRLHDRLISQLESNCYSNTKKGKIKEATGIVNLKSNHKWTDRTQTDLTSKGESIQQLTPFVIQSNEK